jgi:hypothetical protein
MDEEIFEINKYNNINISDDNIKIFIKFPIWAYPFVVIIILCCIDELVNLKYLSIKTIAISLFLSVISIYFILVVLTSFDFGKKNWINISNEGMIVSHLFLIKYYAWKDFTLIYGVYNNKNDWAIKFQTEKSQKNRGWFLRRDAIVMHKMFLGKILCEDLVKIIEKYGGIKFRSKNDA